MCLSGCMPVCRYVKVSHSLRASALLDSYFFLSVRLSVCSFYSTFLHFFVCFLVRYFVLFSISISILNHGQPQQLVVSSLDNSIWRFFARCFSTFEYVPTISRFLCDRHHKLLDKEMKEKTPLLLHFLSNTLCPRLQHTHFLKEIFKGIFLCHLLFQKLPVST